MSFADPQSITVQAGAKSLARVVSGDYSGAFADTTDGLTLSIQHATGRRNRSTARLQVDKIGTDPLIPTVNRPYSMTAYLVLDTPLQGFSVSDQTYNLVGLLGWLSTTTNYNKFINRES